MRVENIEPPLLGIFGQSEDERIAAALFNITGNKTLKSFLGWGGWNTGLIRKLSANYASLKNSGAVNASALSLQAGTTADIATEFIKIKGDKSIIAPSVIQSITAPVASYAKQTAKTLNIALIAAAVLGGGYLLTQAKGFIPHAKA